MARLLVIMGSGETAPTMVKPHRALFDRVGDAPAVALDTPYGFQENADDISERTQRYFADSVGRKVRVVSWRTRDQDTAPRERSLAALRDAGWIFAGPGSPTYALRQWRETQIPQILAERLRRGGVVVFASAAALTLGSHTVPVYEIYKVGADPCWVEGMDLVRTATGMPAVVIPHYDNAEGGHHDTRFCYLGERRLSAMEAELPDESFIIGIDEHTAVVFDLDASTASVIGNGTMTVRRRGHSTVYATGSVVAFDALSGGGAAADPLGHVTGTGQPGDDTHPEGHGTGSSVTLHTETDRVSADFDAARAERDADGCVAVVLAMHQLIDDWSADNSDDGEYARSALRHMVVSLGDLAGSTDPAREALPRVMDLVIEMRRTAREARDFATADAIRDRVAAAGVEIRDTPDGATWHLR